MHIKRVIIHGFKSYNDTAIFGPFSPGQNALVGLNGSGKSNFYKAIEFVLLDEYAHIRVNDRKSLLHEGQGESSMTAYVEIVFDNTSRVIPIEKDEVSIRRAISLQKDEYYVDRKHSTRQDVHNLLESCGFSPSSGYYIVRQGKVNSLATMRDEERLDLLMDIAGTKFYDSQREESLKVLSESHVRAEKIEESLNYIKDRLEKLESEKAELDEYEKKDRKRRALEFLIQQHIINEIKDEIADKEKEKEQENSTAEEIRREISTKDGQLESLNEELDEIKTNEKAVNREKSELDDKEHDLLRVQTRTELKVEKLKHKLENANDIRQIKENELEKVEKEYLISKEEENKVVTELDSVEERKASVEGKIHVITHFASGGVIEDPKPIEEEIKKGRQSMIKMTQEKDLYDNEIEKSKRELSDLENDFELSKSRLSEMQKEQKEKSENKKDLLASRKDIWRNQTLIEKDQRKVQQQIELLQSKAEHSIPSEVSNGIEALKQLNENGVYGPVINLIEVDEIASTAAFSIAKGKLYYVVVDNEKTATRLTRHLQSNKLGRVSFIILDRVKDNEREIIPEIDYLISHIKFEKRFEPVINQIFGGICLCDSLKIATEISDTRKINCVTHDGDFVSAYGLMTGGSKNEKKSPIFISSSISKRKSLINEYEIKNQENQRELRKIDSEIESIDSFIVRSEGAISQIQFSISEKQILIQQKAEEIKRKSHLLEEKESNIREIQFSIKGLEERISSILTFDKMDSKLRDDLLSLSQELAYLDEKRIGLVQKRIYLRSRIRDDLLPKQKTLKDTLLSLKTEAILNKLNYNNGIASESTKKLLEVRKRISFLSERLNELGLRASSLENSIQKIQREKDKQEKMLATHTKQIERIMAKVLLLQQKLEEQILHGKELGTYPTEEIARYNDVRTSILYNKLHRINEKLTLFRYVNKKAHEQHRSFSAQRDELIHRKEELESSEQSITKLISALDSRKNEAIEHTFAQISDHFASIFLLLIPKGSGYLTLLKNPDANDQPSGVSVRVQFDEYHEPLSLSQLSGGQKSLVALALILAIQKFSPAPFYLFDEVDSALDPGHRESVSRLLQSLVQPEDGTQGAQFIITTFKPEFLENSEKFFAVKSEKGHSLALEINKAEAVRVITEEN